VQSAEPKAGSETIRLKKVSLLAPFYRRDEIILLKESKTLLSHLSRFLIVFEVHGHEAFQPLKRWGLATLWAFRLHTSRHLRHGPASGRHVATLPQVVEASHRLRLTKLNISLALQLSLAERLLLLLHLSLFERCRLD